MKQSAITRYFKQEVHIDWVEADNCYGMTLDNVQKKEYTARVVLEKLSDSILQKYSRAKNTPPAPARSKYTERCPRCKKAYKNKSSLQSHRYFCGRERNLQCAHCLYKTGRKENLAVHIWKIHPEGKKVEQSGNDDVGRFSRVCQKCNKISPSLCPSKCENCLHKLLLYQCNTCSKLFESYSKSHYHWDTRCGVKGYYNCTRCDFKSVWRSKVVQHMKRAYSMLESDEEFENIQWIGINDDIRENLESSPYRCPKCTKVMNNSKVLSKHIQVCGGSEREKNSDITLKNRNIQSEPGVCSKCGQEFEHIYSLNKHVRYCQKVPVITRINDEKYIEVVKLDEDNLKKSTTPIDRRNAKTRELAVKYCNKCHEETAIEQGRKLDSRLSCNKCKFTLRYKCKKCLKEYRRFKSILFHLNDVCDPQEEFKCTQCNYKAPSAIYVRNHYRSVHATSSIECKKCGKKFRSSDYIRKHMLRCGVKAKFQCEHCPFKSKLKVYLRQHIFRSHMEPVVIDRRESIKISRQRFSRAKSHLQAHCSVCEKEQLLNDRLKNCRICKKILCYKCKTCKKNYAGDDDNACDHVKGYLETIKFECKHCGRGAISEKSLWMHERMCGVEAKFRCRFCKYASKHKNNVAIHEKRLHLNEDLSDAE